MSSSQAWTEISTKAGREAIDDLLAIFGRYCVGGAVVEETPEPEPSPISRVRVKGFLPTWDTEKLHKLEIALLLLSRTSAISEPETRVLEVKDWAESWKTHFGPQHIGDHTVIVPTWRDYAPVPGEIIVRLDPGMAFGTGLHASTRLCLSALERLKPSGKLVLDVGTGSGILAISAALHGAERVDALDVDPLSVKVARENVTLNSVDERVVVHHSTLAGPSRPTNVPTFTHNGYDLLLVNIFAEVIIGMAESLAKAVRRKGHIVASGIISTKAQAVAQALNGVGLELDQRLVEDDWVALICHRG